MFGYEGFGVRVYCVEFSFGAESSGLQVCDLYSA